MDANWFAGPLEHNTTTTCCSPLREGRYVPEP
eukprot:CAMPEP_0115532954 /NCGR_PEP_ID=MMETSP0271-20121206/85854_1 /TAXON_ID=71861 /ORGANISM="Scrippsiella trochoidea, Strain CCMP3099" /LENGTH=31 /DNA_ID= /DNA_START= /DNA_END= /DNA_ORIENTATION=